MPFNVKSRKFELLEGIGDILDSSQVELSSRQGKDSKFEPLPMFRGECAHFHTDFRFSEFVQGFWKQIEGGEYTEEHVSLELGSRLGTWSLHAAAAGIQSYGVEQYQILVENSRKVADKASEQGYIEDEDLCQYTQGDVVESGTWDFSDGSEIGLEDANIIYACFPLGDEVQDIYASIAENMDEDAIAILPEKSSITAREKYFEQAELSDMLTESSRNVKCDKNWVYKLDTRPSNY